MYRLRFNTISQLFDVPGDAQVVLPAEDLFKEIKNGPSEKTAKLIAGQRILAEIPSVLWEGSVQRIKEILSALKETGVSNVLCENIGGFNICSELGLSIHGGMYLNVMNTSSIEQYKALGAEDLTLSFEMPFAKQRALLSRKQAVLDKAKSKEQDTKYGTVMDLPLAMIIYGYLPLMKFRACPAMGKNGCKGCTRDKELVDRKGERFRILCHDSRYSELLNCVPLYVADKGLPKLDIYTLYFTVESKEECEKVFDMVSRSAEPSFRRTAGLYNRELL